MPAKKTFHSIRVRGGARFDVAPTHKGFELPAFRQLVALVTQVGEDAPTFEVAVNTLIGEIAWQRVDTGLYEGVLEGGFPTGKTLILVGQSGDGGFSGAVRCWSDVSNGIHLASQFGNGDPGDGVLYHHGLMVLVYP
jgi:hypothetical protein